MKTLLLIACLALNLVCQAQTEDKKWNIGLHGGATQYKGDLGNDFYNTSTAFHGFGAISVSRFISNHFDINFLATKGRVGANKPSGKFSANVSTATLNFRFNILSSQYIVRPYVYVGGGVMLFDRNLEVSKTKVDYVAPAFGGGLNFRLSSTVNLILQESFMYSTADRRDGIIANENDAYLFHTAGITFNFGHKKDEDKDGVADRLDKCLNTPAGVAVNRKGCPFDKDMDGVADYLDTCPEIAGSIALSGCPDKDGDGITDKDDSCPDEKGTVALGGCPDKDGDGIADKDDRCIDLAGSAALKGCPDTDKDGVADVDDKCSDTKSLYHVDAKGCPMDDDNDGIFNEDDACPQKAGITSLNGCPDTDGDGVADNEDRCPAIRGTINNKGCPEMAKADIIRITNIASKIFFETNSDKLKVASLVQLDELSEILNRYEGANLTIEGHTDSQGDDAFNLSLSQKRTDAVKTYLMGKGIFESRLIASGLGESKPIGDNTTSIGRAKNRRVELKTSY